MDYRDDNHYINQMNTSIWFKKLIHRGNGNQLPSVYERFVTKFVKSDNPDDCWNWTGAIMGRNKKQGDGYGMINIRALDLCICAHKLSWMVFHDVDEVPNGLVIRHSCHNKRCVNPKHLLLGTHLDNARDSVAILTHSYGERNGNNILDEEKVKEIRENKAGLMGKEFAEKFGVGKATISQAKNGVTWKYL